jgi:hypothetical protein
MVVVVVDAHSLGVLFKSESTFIRHCASRILDRPEFNDPEQLQELFRKGVEDFKEVGTLMCECLYLDIGTCTSVYISGDMHNQPSTHTPFP